MKKMLSIFLSLLLLILLLVACTSNKTLDEFETKATLEKTVLYDNKDVVIIANELSYTAFSARLSVSIENNSDKELSFTCGSMGYNVNSVNGYMIEDGYLNCDISSGESKTEEIVFDYKSLKIYGITEIADLEIGFQISDEDYNSVYTGPLPVKTSINNSYDYDKNSYQNIIENGAFENEFECTVNMFSNDELYNKQGVSIASATVATNKNGEPVLLLEIQNASAGGVYVSTKEVYINEKLVYDYLWSSDTINSGKTFVKDISLLSLAEEYEGNIGDIENISKITFTFSVGENWYDSADSKQITIILPNVKVIVEAD